MKKIGIIVEFNPIHNGHLILINKIKEKADIIIAVISSSFTMRGELSIFNKFDKTKFSLKAGIDLLIELPFVYTIERADIYAKNAVNVLKQFNVDEIWCGSEENNIKLYEDAYINFNNNYDLSDGSSYKLKSLNNLNFKSNDLLGFFYYKTIKDNNYDIKLNLIKREGMDYLDINNGNIPSALAIRSDLSLIKDNCPNYVYENVDKILDKNKLFKYLKYQILNINNLKNIFMVDEGIENALTRIYNYDNIDDYISSLISKRYTKTRIRRMLLYVLFNITKNDINNLAEYNIFRILGYNDNGKSYLNNIKKDINIVTNIKNGISNALDIEIKISKILDNIFDSNLFELEQKGPIKL